MNIGTRYFREVHRWGLLIIPVSAFLVWFVPSKADQSTFDWLLFYVAIGALLFFGLFVEWPSRAGFTLVKKPWRYQGDPRDHQGIR